MAQTLAPPQLMYRWRPYGRHLYYHICPRNVLSYCYMCISTINTVLIDSGIQVPSFLPSGVLMEFRWKPCESSPVTAESHPTTRRPDNPEDYCTMFRPIRESMPPFCLRYLTVKASMPTFEKKVYLLFLQFHPRITIKGQNELVIAYKF